MKKATWVSIGAGFIRACVIIYTIPQIVASLKDIKVDMKMLDALRCEES